MDKRSVSNFLEEFFHCYHYHCYFVSVAICQIQAKTTLRGLQNLGIVPPHDQVQAHQESKCCPWNTYTPSSIVTAHRSIQDMAILI